MDRASQGDHSEIIVSSNPENSVELWLVFEATQLPQLTQLNYWVIFKSVETAVNSTPPTLIFFGENCAPKVQKKEKRIFTCQNMVPVSDILLTFCGLLDNIP